MAMNPEIKARWVAALRSGEYQQGREALECGGAFCCLGVLCDLYRKTHGEPIPMSGLEDPAEPELPGPVVCRWAEIEQSAHVEIDGKRAPLFDHNDGVSFHNLPPRSFSEIADAIEAQL